MASIACVVLFSDPRVRNVRGNPVAYPRSVLFTAGRRDFLSRSGTVRGGEPTASRFDLVGLRATSCEKGQLFRAFGLVHRGPWGAGGGAVDLMPELMSCYFFLPSSAPLVAYGSGGGRWSMWTKQQMTVALRGVVALAGGRTSTLCTPLRLEAQPTCRQGCLPGDVATRGRVGV